MVRLKPPPFTPDSLVGPWPDGPWWLLGAAALAAPFAVLSQGADLHLAIAAGLACLVSPTAAIEAMMGVARLAQLAAPPR
ncbi:MAG: hypothetical protein AVDCRST_MAG27-2774 [uncultured Craurococcus sp.]|uniref:Uncharacterized protein n=1 Tax=uncultured Craurococcus sp. TaxID=1135998 RepID=A0A6J4IKI7_9PROT|nr:MAG: hypothetical protein AVDCRST_MAG27-2774 [uncultured Craurococcus sp.]